MMTTLLINFLLLIWFFASPTMSNTLDTSSLTSIRLYMLNQQDELSWREEKLSDGVELFSDESYDPSKPLMLIAHGWFQHAEFPTIVMLVESLFTVKFYEKMNIMVLNTPHFSDSAVSNLLYFSTVVNKLEVLSKDIADIFNIAIERGLIKPENINMVGLSLGAQLSGYVGRAVNGEIYSIVGLDPAGPGFDSTLLQYWTKLQHVSHSDAQFVHLYHTNSKTFGTNQRVGTADFEFNEGMFQPGCATNLDPKCSHTRAFFIFNDIILGDNKLKALQCNTIEKFKDCTCQRHPRIFLRYPIDTSAKGLYFLRTTSEAPFGLGNEGISCWGHQLESLEKQDMDSQSKLKKALNFITGTIKKRWTS